MNNGFARTRLKGRVFALLARGLKGASQAPLFCAASLALSLNIFFAY